MQLNLKYFVRCLAMLCICSALSDAVPAHTGSAEKVHIVRYENMQAEDSYKFDFLTSDGQKREETGLLVNGGQELVVFGSYSYTGPDNKLYLVEYVADRNGFKPTFSMISSLDEGSQNLAGPPPQITTAGFDPDSAVRPHVLKSLLG